MIGRDGLDRLDRLAVVLRRPDAVTAGQLGDCAVCWLTHVEGRVDRIEVVLADEEYGQMMHGRKVHALVEYAGLGRRIAEENRRD